MCTHSYSSPHSDAVVIPVLQVRAGCHRERKSLPPGRTDGSEIILRPHSWSVAGQLAASPGWLAGCLEWSTMLDSLGGKQRAEFHNSFWGYLRVTLKNQSKKNVM